MMFWLMGLPLVMICFQCRNTTESSVARPNRMQPLRSSTSSELCLCHGVACGSCSETALEGESPSGWRHQKTSPTGFSSSQPRLPVTRSSMVELFEVGDWLRACGTPIHVQSVRTTVTSPWTWLKTSFRSPVHWGDAANWWLH